MKGLVFAALLVLFAGFPALAQSTAPGINQVASNIVIAAYKPQNGKDAATQNFEKEFLRSFNATAQGQQIAKQVPQALSAAIAVGKAEFAHQFDLVVVPTMTDAIARIYVENFSLNELEKILSYYRTPQAQRFLASFQKGEPEITNARNDAVVNGYRSSQLGVKEGRLSSAIASAMTSSVVAAAPRFMPIVNAKIKSAFTDALAKTKKSK